MFGTRENEKKEDIYTQQTKPRTKLDTDKDEETSLKYNNQQTNKGEKSKTTIRQPGQGTNFFNPLNAFFQPFAFLPAPTGFSSSTTLSASDSSTIGSEKEWTDEAVKEWKERSGGGGSGGLVLWASDPEAPDLDESSDELDRA